MRASRGGLALLRVCYELGNDLCEHGEMSLDGITSMKQLRQALLHLADELLIDPEDDLGDWKLFYTDRKTGALELCDGKTSFTNVRSHAAELRVKAEHARSK